MSPRRNFGNGGGKPKKQHKGFQTLKKAPQQEKNVAKGPSNSEKAPHKEKNIAKRPPHREKKVAERLLNGKKSPP